MRRTVGVLTCTLWIAVMLFVAGCGKDEKVETQGTPGARARQEAEKSGEQPAEQPSTPLPPIDVEKIKALLPAKLAGMDRGEVEGQSMQMGELSMANAQTTYTAGDKSIQINLLDTGTLNAQISQGMQMRVRFSNDKGSSGTTTVQGYPAWEVVDKENNSVQLMVYVGRFAVTAEGKDVSIDDLKNAVGEIDMKKVEAVK
jgi:hypothetical protein